MPYASPTPGADALRAQIAQLAQSLQLNATGGIALVPTAFSPEKDTAAGRAVHIDRHGNVSIDLAPPPAPPAAAGAAARRDVGAADLALRDSGEFL